jgi:HlyD family secretion protein
MKPRIRQIGMALAAAVLIAASAAWYLGRSGNGGVVCQTAPITRGDLLVTISATGTVEPEEVIDVGAQVAGQILSFGRDVDGRAVDYGSKVAAGTVLATIDDAVYAAEATSAKAQVQSAQAGLERAEADLEQFKAKLNQAGRDWLRAQKIGPSQALSQASYDAYRSAFETAKANVAVGQAAILQAKAGVVQARAGLSRAERNLGYCTITSPVDGVIIDRRVNIGQTVVASLNAPSLFLIAKDLTRMQVWVAVNEADIGKIHPGQAVTFTVDAFPEATFKGSVGKVRLNAAMTQNVVTYTVEIVTGNRDGRLLPYLTANVQFELQRVPDALQVPNAALRWRPRNDQIAPRYRETGAPTASRNADKRRPSAAGDGDNAHGRRAGLWIPDDDYVRPITVHAGASLGTRTVVTGEGLVEGMAVVTGMQDRDAGAGDTRNPFAPQIPRRSRTTSQGSH